MHRAAVSSNGGAYEHSSGSGAVAQAFEATISGRDTVSPSASSSEIYLGNGNVMTAIYSHAPATGEHAPNATMPEKKGHSRPAVY